MDSSWVLPAALLGLGVVGNSVMLWRLWNHYNKLTNKIQKKELMDALNKIMEEVDLNKSHLAKVESSLEEHKKLSLKDLHKVGFKRFNPFSDTGGDQSFSLAVLDTNNDGFMISSFHSRENTRLYAKVISNGKTRDQQLSREENEVLNQALKK